MSERLLVSPSSDKDHETADKARHRGDSAFKAADGVVVIVCYCVGSPCCCYEDGFDASGVVSDPYQRVKP